MPAKALTNLVIAGGATAELAACLDSLKESAYDPQRTLVIDNSPAGLPAELTQRFADVQFVRGDEPRTFTHAVNLGLQRARSEGAQLVFLLNDDVTVEANAAELLAGAEARHGPGVFAPEIWPADGSPRYRYRLDWRKRLLVREPAGETSGGEPFAVDYAEGSAVMISSEVLEEVGGFDEWFGFYYEDADFSLRAKAAGFPVLEIPGARVFHVTGASAGRGLSPFKAYWRSRNTVHFALKHRAHSRPCVNAAYHIGGFLLPEALRAIGKSLTGDREAARTLAALSYGTVDSVTGRKNPPAV